MKKLLITLTVVFISNTVFSQTTSENYIKNTSYLIETQDGNATNDDKVETVEYYDGLGRTKQVISKQLGGNREDNITPITYDNYGRQNVSYLPYSRNVSSLNYENPNTTGLFSSLENQYLAKHPDDFDGSTTPNPYAITVFEKSPLDRVSENAASGYDWRYDENNVSLIDVQVPIPLNYSSPVDTDLFPTNSSAQTLGEINISINNAQINIDFEMIMQYSSLNVGQIMYLNTAPYVLDNYFIGQLIDDSNDLIPYFVQIQNNYLIITSTDPTYQVSGLYCHLSLDIDIPAEYETHQVEQSQNNTIRYEYGTNSYSTDNVKEFGVEFIGNTNETELVYIGNYSPYSLYKTITKNENWQPNADPNIIEKNNTSVEYRDRLGRIVLKRTFNNNEPHDTHYVYDKYGNLTYIIPPLASDGILELGNQGFRVSSQVNYPWTSLVEISKSFAEEYNKKLSDYENEDLLNADIENKYGGQGGFTVSTYENSDLVTLSLSFSVTDPITLKKGILCSLKDYGDFKDSELGRISADDFEYIFVIKGNAIIIEKQGKGKGELLSVNETFNNTGKLAYSKDYLWTTILDVDSKFATTHEKAVVEKAKETNQSILTTYVENQYGGHGGLNISIDENDIVSVNLNSSSSVPLKLKQGLVIPLNTKRRLSNRELGSISGNGYDYYFSIKENSLFINGYGLVTNISVFFSSPPPPETPTIDPESVGGLCYIYHYDDRNRVMNKKIPGKGWQYNVYDKLDRPILSQDARMRLDNEWLFTKYDVFGRVIYTGLYSYTPTGSAANEQLELQSIVDNQTNPVWYENKEATAQTINGTTIFYSSNSYPTSNIDILTINYYDDYNFNNAGLALTLPTTILGQDVDDQVKTLLTGTKTRVLDTDDWITSITHYDGKSRPIYVASKNDYLNTLDFIKTDLDFVGKIITKEVSHTKDSNAAILVIDSHTYDHAGRLLTITQSINNSAPELIANNTYNEYGQLESKKVGGSVEAIPENSNGLQSVDYDFNIRGWLKTINEGNTANGDLFGFKINYNTPEITNALPLYNGNISEIYWITTNDNFTRSYTYKYDALNRIKEANYSGSTFNFPDNVSQPQNQSENFSLKEVTYDKNGNITHLERYGVHFAYAGIGGNTTTDIVDGLDYFYEANSNKLLNVTDFADNGFNFGAPDIDHGGFLEKYQDGDKYEYDINGNLVKDHNKNITDIEYNHLNMPVKVTFINDPDDISFANFEINYVYDALGKKLRKYVVNNAQHDYTHYSGDFVYSGNIEPSLNLKSINHPEGYIEPNGSSFQYIYQYRDHLNNTRLSYSDDDQDGSVNVSEIRREQNYYPFGLEHRYYNNAVNGVKNDLKTYQGQEFTDDFGINIHEWKYRVSDPAIGRFWQIDPLAENYAYNSTYAFQENKLGLGIELEGLELTDSNGNIYYDPSANEGEGAFTDAANNNIRRVITVLRSTETGEVQFQKSFDHPIVFEIDMKTPVEKLEHGQAGEATNVGVPISEYDFNTGKNSIVNFDVTSSTTTAFYKKVGELLDDLKDGGTPTLGQNKKVIPKGFNIIDIFAAILGHEIEHTTDENATLTAQKKSKDEIEKKPTEISDKIIDEINENKKEANKDNDDDD